MKKIHENFYIKIEVNCHTKRIKSVETERFPSLIAEVDDMMICENSTLKENDTRNKSQPVLIPKHCNGICKYVCFLIKRKEEMHSLVRMQVQRHS